MRLVDYLDKGASLDADAPCLTTDGESRTYAEVQDTSRRVASALARRGVRPGDKVAILSANDPTAFTCVFGISRAAAVWCPVNPRNEAAENRELLDLFDCSALIFAALVRALVDKIRGDLPRDPHAGLPRRRPRLGAVVGRVPRGRRRARSTEPPEPVDDVAMIVGTGGTTGRPKGVMLTNTNLETMTALTLMGYPFEGRPVYLALAPLTHAAGVLCFPVLALGGEVVIMRTPDVGAFLDLVGRHAVTHTFLPPTLVYMLLGHPDLDTSDLSSLQCFWYGAAPMSVSPAHRGARAGLADGPAVRPDRGPDDDLDDAAGRPPPPRRLDRHRAALVGRPARSAGPARDPRRATVARSPRGERGEIVVRSSLVMAGYYQDPEATAEVSAHGWHHTGDIGYLDDDNFLFIVDRAKDMIITGGFNVYSTEVEQALMAHPDIQDCAVVGQPDEKWGERVVAVVQPLAGHAGRPRRGARLRQGAHRGGEGPQGGPRLGRPAALEGRQGAQDRHQGPPRHRLTGPWAAGPTHRPQRPHDVLTLGASRPLQRPGSAGIAG